MKNTTKLKIWGFVLLGLSITLIYLGVVVFRDRSWDHFARKPNFAFLVPGMFLGIFSLRLIFLGFSPQLARFGSKVHSETIDYAKDNMKEAISKSADLVIPTVTPYVKTAYSEITNKSGDKAKQLQEAKSLFERELISEEEYKLLRKSILGIDN